jgi:hypothetical protein
MLPFCDLAARTAIDGPPRGVLQHALLTVMNGVLYPAAFLEASEATLLFLFPQNHMDTLRKA